MKRSLLFTISCLLFYSFALGQIRNLKQPIILIGDSVTTSIDEKLYTVNIQKGDTTYQFVPTVWPLNLDKAVKKQQKSSLKSYGYSDLSHIPNSHTIDKTKDIGEIDIIQDANQYGALSYRIPFGIYQSENNLKPTIALSYNSLGNHGIAGTGWQLSGLSGISATNSTIYFDNLAGPAKLNKNSAFVLDGVRLIDLKTGNTSLINYQSEVGNINVTAYLSGDIVKYFLVKYPNGNIAIFGYENNTSSKLNYPLTKIEDLKGNYLEYSYNEINNTYWVTSINYGGKKGTTNVAHFAKINFTYETRPDVNSTYIDGVEVKLDRRLKEVTTYVNNLLLRTYSLSYENKTNVSLLQKVECSSEGKSLNPLIFYYGENNNIVRFEKSNVILTEYFANASVPDLFLIKGKFDAYSSSDGLIAYPKMSNYGLLITKKNWLGQVVGYQYGSTYHPDQNLLIYNDDLNSSISIPSKLKAENGFLQLCVLDVDGDGTEEVVKINSSIVNNQDRMTFKVYNMVTSLGQSYPRLKYEFSSDYGGVIEWSDLYSPPSRVYITGDFIGNGKQSILSISHCKNIKGDNISSWATLVDFDNRRKSTVYDKTCFNFDYEDFVFPIDFDGDGKTDICHIHANGITIYTFNTSGQLYEIGSFSGFSRSSIKKRELLLGDINGDGKTDIIFSPNKNDYTIKSISVPCGVCEACMNGGGLQPLSLSSNTNNTNESNNLIESDTKDSIKLASLALRKPIDDDDMYCMNPYIYEEKVYGSTARRWTTLISTGKQFISNYYDISVYEGMMKFALQDMNGDNIPDLVINDQGTIRMYLTENGKINTTSENQTVSVHSNAHFITGTVEQGYKMSQLFSIYNSELIPITFTRNDLKQRLLTGIINSSGIVSKHSYERIGKGYSNVYSEGSKCNYPYMNLSGSMVVYSGTTDYLNNNSISNISRTYERGITDLRGKGFLGFEKVSTYDNMRGKTIIQTFDPVKFGTLSSSVTPETSITNYYTVSTGSNKVSKVTLSSKTENDKLDDILINYSYSYDSYDNPIKEIVDYGNGQKLTIDNKYTNHTGNIYLLGELYEQTITNEKSTAKISKKTLTTFDTKRQPINRKSYTNNNLTNEESFSYDLYGNVIESQTKAYASTFWLSNKFIYDTYGRLTRKTNKLGLFVDYSYDSKFRMISEKNNKAQQTTYVYDNWDRSTKVTYPDGTEQTNTLAWATSPTDAIYYSIETSIGQPTKQIFYDALGRGIREGELRYDGKYLYVDNVYDSQGRLQKTSVPFKGSSATNWNIFAYDSYNRITEIDYSTGKKETYSYDKKKKTIVKDGISRTEIIDATQQIVSVIDPAGTINFELGPDGQPLSVIAPGNIKTEFTYDTYGRQISISDPSAGIKTFEYDSSGNLVKETAANGKSIKMTYDNYSRIIQKEYVGEQTITSVYNTDGLLSSETSTNGTAKNFVYDAFSRIATQKEVTVDNKWLQKILTYANGNIASTAYSSNTGNLVTENYTYTNGHLTEIKLNNTTLIWKINAENDQGVTSSIGTGTLTRTYSFDVHGLPTARTVKNGSVIIQDHSYNFNVQTGNLNWRKDNARNIQENFGYDNLNRLTSFGGKTITYDNKGNITDYSTIAKFIYGTSKPYAIETVTPYGTEIPLRNQTISYNSMMRPVSIAENGYIATFSYNGDGDRVKMQLKKDNVDQLIRYYISGQYEIESGIAGSKERLYLGGDAYSAVAVYVKDGTGAWNINYICRDYLGNITHITNTAGALIQELSYDPWGRLRNPANHVLYASGSEPVLLLGRGFSGHEHLPMFGLINMNARLYDPVLGRFLSPDPYVQNPYFSQNYNRYSYGWNNPLRFTDPNGEFIHIIVGAVIGGVANLTYKLITGQVTDFKSGLVAFGIGAAAGAIGAATGGAAFLAAGGSFAVAGAGGFMAAATFSGTAYLSSTLVQSVGNHVAFGDPYPSAGDVAKGFVLSTVGGGAAGGTVSALNGRNFWTGNIPRPGASLFSLSSTASYAGTSSMEMRNLGNISPETLKGLNADKIKMQNARQAGIDGEKAVGITGPKETITSHTGTARYRVPDRVTPTTIEEVKNVKSLTFTKQLEDMLIESQNTGKQMIIWTRPNTVIKPPLQYYLNSGQIKQNFIP